MQLAVNRRRYNATVAIGAQQAIESGRDAETEEKLASLRKSHLSFKQFQMSIEDYFLRLAEEINAAQESIHFFGYDADFMGRGHAYEAVRKAAIGAGREQVVQVTGLFSTAEGIGDLERLMPLENVDFRGFPEHMDRGCIVIDKERIAYWKSPERAVHYMEPYPGMFVPVTFSPRTTFLSVGEARDRVAKDLYSARSLEPYEHTGEVGEMPSLDTKRILGRH